jgi:predicted TIM-barrel fold metal-dependent hydrolase
MTTTPTTVQNRYIVVSADMHAGAAVYDYKPYLDSKWYDEFDSWADSYHDPWYDLDPGDAPIKAGVASGASSVNWDSPKRIADLDHDGIAGEVLFPNTAPPFFPSGVLTAYSPTTREEYERRFAGVKAHNRWMADFCKDAPERRAGVGQIFVNDIADAVAEIKYIAEAGLRGGVLLPLVEPGAPLPPFYDPRYEPIWAACAEYDVTINHHSTATGPTNVGGGPGLAANALIESNFWPRRLLWQLVFAGVFARYPRLRVVLTEIQSGWVEAQLRILDGIYQAGVEKNWDVGKFVGEAVDGMTMSPTDYFHRNFYICASFMLPVDAGVHETIGDRVMWGADYPHSEGTFPWSREALRATFSAVPPETTARMIGGTAAEVYKFDLAKLAPIAAKIGPTVDEVKTPLVNGPKVPEQSRCAVFIPGYPGF